MNAPTRACIYLAMAMSIAGSAVVAGKVMVSSMPVFLAAGLGVFVGLLFLLPLAFRPGGVRPRLDLRSHVVLMAQGLFGVVLYRVLIFQGLNFTSAAAAGLISSAAPAFIALMAWLLLKEAMPAIRAAGTLAVTVGILAVNLLPFLNDASQAAHALKGNLLVLGAVLCESVFSVLSKARCRPMPALYRTALVTLYAFIGLLPLAGYEALHFDWSAATTSALACILYYGFFVSFLSYVFWFRGIAVVSAGVAASFTGFVPLAGVLLSRAVLGETITPAHWIGLALILAGVGLSCLSAQPGSRPILLAEK